MIELDIFSDTVCPWCYIGKKRLEKAIEKHSHLEIKQTWRPFQLNPGMPPDGMDRQEYLVSKFGSCLLYTSPSPRDRLLSRMPSSA